MILNVCQLTNYLPIEAIHITNYLINLSPIIVNWGIILKQLYNKDKSHVDHLQVLGLVVYLYILKRNQSKLENKTTRYIFLRWNNQIKAYRISNPSYYKIQINCNIVFDETLIGFDHIKFYSILRDESKWFLKIDILLKKSLNSIN